MDFDTRVKLHIFETIANTTRMPTSSDIASALGCTVSEVEDVFAQLYQKRLLVLEPGNPSHIRMAPPFSGIETQHLVKIDDKTYFANCAWDAFGIAAALKRDADITSSCPDCGESLSFQIKDGKPLPQEAIAHFAVPASQWWKDIIHT
jgi:transcription initiation factor IIE alpha subunit